MVVFFQADLHSLETTVVAGADGAAEGVAEEFAVEMVKHLILLADEVGFEVRHAGEDYAVVGFGLVRER